jgi:aminoglycoside N3'-acetyltransferase
MSTMRERFEVWAQERKLPMNLRLGGYVFSETAQAWAAWQAVEASREEEIAALKAALEQITKIENQYVGSDWEEIEQARNIAQEALK